MLVNKIITGCVIQTYDTTQGRFVSQEFIAGDDVAYKDKETGEPVESLTASDLPFKMSQPVIVADKPTSLTTERKKLYVANPARCPYCSSDLLFTERKEQFCNWIAEETQCHNCAKTWWDIYILTTIEERPPQ